MSKPKIYIAGPYSGDSMNNIRNAIDIGEHLYKIGYSPYIPHLTGFIDLIHPKSYSFWMDYDHEWLSICDVLYRMEGLSIGADREEMVALGLKISIVYSLDEATEWYKTKGWRSNV